MRDVKKTTDDCYTPKEVMDVVINYVNEKYPLAGKKIVRPFYPGGDFSKSPPGLFIRAVILKA